MITVINKATKGMQDWVKEYPPLGLKFAENPDLYGEDGFVVMEEPYGYGWGNLWNFLKYPRFVAQIRFWEPITVRIHDKTWYAVLLEWARGAEAYWKVPFEIVIYDSRYGPDERLNVEPAGGGR